MSDVNLDELIDVQQAMRIIDSQAINRPSIRSVIPGEISGRVLAQHVIADRDYPPFDKSLLDGFAVMNSDISSLPASLKIIGEVPAGRLFNGELGPGESVSTMTGAPVPRGAERVVPVEKARADRDRVVILDALGSSGIHQKGCEARKGDLVIRAGTCCDSRHVAVVAQVGLDRVQVFDRPRAAIIVTGDEIVDSSSAADMHQIRDANTMMLEQLLLKLGADVSQKARVPDRLDLIKENLERALDESDLIFITGGMSMGKFDFVPQALVELGFEPKIRKLRIRPGKPFVFAVRVRGQQKQFAFGLPGNPVSAYICTLVLATRLIDRLRGLEAPIDRSRRFILGRDVPENGPREFYQPAAIQQGNLLPLNWIGSADVFTLARAEVLLVRPAGDPARKTGSPVVAIEIPR